MQRTAAAPVTVLGLSLALVGCSDGIFGPREVERIGIVDHFGESEGVISAPTTVVLGEPFTVTIRTYGGGCTSVGPTRRAATVEGDVLITPIDTTIEGPDVVCPAILKRLAHEVTLTFREIGQETIHVRGRRVARGEEDEVVFLTHAVSVVAAGGG